MDFLHAWWRTLVALFARFHWWVITPWRLLRAHDMLKSAALMDELHAELADLRATPTRRYAEAAQAYRERAAHLMRARP